jgi:hypothetical protein
MRPSLDLAVSYRGEADAIRREATDEARWQLWYHVGLCILGAARGLTMRQSRFSIPDQQFPRFATCNNFLSIWGERQ